MPALESSQKYLLISDVHKDPDYDRRVHDYTAAFHGMDNDGDGSITFEVKIKHVIEQLCEQETQYTIGE